MIFFEVCCSHAASLEDCELVYQIENQRRAPPLSVQHEINEVPKAYPDECQPWEDESRVQPCKARTALKFVEEFGVCLKKDFKFKGRVTDKIAPNRVSKLLSFLLDVKSLVESVEYPIHNHFRGNECDYKMSRSSRVVNNQKHTLGQ